MLFCTSPYIRVHIQNIKIMKNKKVVAIFYADARNLSGVKRIGTEVTSVPDDVWNEIDIEVPADLQITSKIEDKNEISQQSSYSANFAAAYDTDISLHTRLDLLTVQRCLLVILNAPTPY